MTEVNRDYSQFEEIRNYRDRSMMKWQGFFLSEHRAEMKRDRSEKIYYPYLVRGNLK